MNYTLRTLSYFLVWGIVYGALLGGYAGTALIPFYGSIVGFSLGLMCGLVGGVIAGIAAVTSEAANFDPDTNLDLHRRRIARNIGASVVLAPLLFWIVGTGVNRGFFGLGLILLLALPWGALSAAYVGHRFPDFIIKIMTKGKRGQRAEESDSFVPHSSVNRSATALWTRGRGRWAFIMGFGGTLVAMLVNLITYMTVRRAPFAQDIISALCIAILGGIAGEFLWAYIALGNGALLTFLKRLVFQDYFPDLPPNRLRNIITTIAFVFTLGITWWTFIFAPVCASLAAYHVYHSLALPDDGLEKAKRKQKNVLALEDNLMDESPLLNEIEMTTLQEQQS
jgi:hypothetical protein